MARLSVELQRFFLGAECVEAQKITPNGILEVVGERAFGFLFVVLSVPAALPIPTRVYAAFFGIVILLLAIQLIAGAEQPWLPKKIRTQGLNREAVQSVIRKGLPWLQRVETIARPRLTPVCTSRIGRSVIGWAIALAAISIALPISLPNALPAAGIFVTGFGLLDDDGVISLGGLMICAIATTLTGILLYLMFR
jgi:hypothetical protein